MSFLAEIYNLGNSGELDVDQQCQTVSGGLFHQLVH